MHQPSLPETPCWLAPLRDASLIPEWMPDAVPMAWLVIVLLSVLCYLGTRNIKRQPTGLQNKLELLVSVLLKLTEPIMGKWNRSFLPFLACLFIYIFTMNLFGLIPGMKSPTANINTTAALALIVFAATQYHGVRVNGFLGYAKHFTGEIWWLAPLMVPIHLIGELARPLSLSVRLFGNIMGKDLVIAMLFVLVLPLLGNAPPMLEGVKVPFALSGISFLIGTFVMIFAVFASLIQAMIFTILAAVYIAGAVAGHESE